MICTWCGSTMKHKSKDHVFPRGLGGQLGADLWVYACERCRTSISKAEDEVAHRSHLSAHRFAKGLAPRRKKRPSSGLVEPQIRLVKDPTTNRYSVFSLRAGESHPRILPALEVDLENDKLFFHGAGPEDSQRLIGNILSLLRNGPGATGLIGEITVRLLDEFLSDIAKDADFNPRIYLSEREHLEICTRNPQEALALARAVAYLATTGALKSYEPSGWKSWTIPGGTPHNVAFEFDGRLFDRVVLKIACALIAANIRANDSSQLDLPAAQSIVRGDSEIQPGMVTPLSGASRTDREFSDRLIAIAGVRRGRLIGLVGLYGGWYSADLGIAPDRSRLPHAIGAMCHVVEGRDQRWLSTEEAERFMRSYEHGSLGTPLEGEAGNPAVSKR